MMELQRCLVCKSENVGRMMGSGWIELICWLVFIPAGAVYSIWRRGKGRVVCQRCGHMRMIPRQLYEEGMK